MKIHHHLELTWKGGLRLFVIADSAGGFWFDALTAGESLGVTKFRALAASEELGTKRGDGRTLLRSDTVEEWLSKLRLGQAKAELLRVALKRQVKLMALLEPTPYRRTRVPPRILPRGRETFSTLRYLVGRKEHPIVLAHRGDETWVRLKDVLDLIGVVNPRAEQMRLAARPAQVEKARRREERLKLTQGREYRAPESRKAALRLVEFSLAKLCFPGAPPAWAIELSYLDAWVEEMRLRAREDLQYAFDAALGISRAIETKKRR